MEDTSVTPRSSWGLISGHDANRAHRYARLPSVEDTLNHPAFPTTVWNLEPDQKGVAAVAQKRGGPYRITWEIHGVGPSKLLVRPTIPFVYLT
jgi:glycylpeptide N-tetradecanoyltransferase